jgi:hypothetical protein
VSVDVATPSISFTRPLEGSVRHLFVIIGGWASEEAFKSSPSPALPPTPVHSSSGDLLRRVNSSELVLQAGEEKRVIGLKGRMLDSDVDDAFQFIINFFDPRGKLIIHGHSMGGAAVHRLCRKIDAEAPFCDLKLGGFTTAPVSTGVEYEARKPSFPGPFSRPGDPPPEAVPGPPGRPVPWFDPGAKANPKVRVDLLITVDAAIGNVSGSMNRSVARCVRTNLNSTKRPESIWSNRVAAQMRLSLQRRPSSGIMT